MKLLFVVVGALALCAQNPVLDGMQRGVMLGTIISAQRTIQAEQYRLEAETRKLNEQTEKLRRQNEESLKRIQKNADTPKQSPVASDDAVYAAADALKAKYDDFPQVYSMILDANSRLKAGKLPLVEHLEIWYFGVKYAQRSTSEADRLILADFPEMTNDASALFQKAREFYVREVTIDPAAIKNPRILRLCVELAKASLAGAQ